MIATLRHVIPYSRSWATLSNRTTSKRASAALSNTRVSSAWHSSAILFSTTVEGQVARLAPFRTERGIEGDSGRRSTPLHPHRLARPSRVPIHPIILTGTNYLEADPGNDPVRQISYFSRMYALTPISSLTTGYESSNPLLWTGTSMLAKTSNSASMRRSQARCGW